MDYNATRPLRESAKSKIHEVMNIYGNPSSIHKEGRSVHGLIENVRHTIAELLKINAERIIFSSGATESNNTILKHFSHVQTYISTQEHPSVYSSASNVVFYETDENGVCKLDHLEDLLKKTTEKNTIVSMISANNETGVIQPIEEAQQLCKNYGVYFHTDAVQAMGRVKHDWKKFDFLTFSGHKIGALQGVGVTIIPEGFSLNPLLIGGGQEKSLRSGTENFMGIASLASVFQETMNENWDNAKQKRNLLENELKQKCSKAIIFGERSERLSNTSFISMPGVKNDIQVINFDLNGISLSAGSACSSGKVRKFEFLEKLGYSNEDASTFIRVSLMPNVTDSDIHKFISVWDEIYQQCFKEKRIH